MAIRNSSRGIYRNHIKTEVYIKIAPHQKYVLMKSGRGSPFSLFELYIYLPTLALSKINKTIENK